MHQLEFTDYELSLIKASIRLVIEEKMTIFFMADYVKLLDKIQNAST